MTTEERNAWFAEVVRGREKAMYRVALLTLRRGADAEDAVAAAILPRPRACVRQKNAL